LAIHVEFLTLGMPSGMVTGYTPDPVPLDTVKSNTAANDWNQGHSRQAMPFKLCWIVKMLGISPSCASRFLCLIAQRQIVGAPARGCLSPIQSEGSVESEFLVWLR
jgi:hypothetical protein